MIEDLEEQVVPSEADDRSRWTMAAEIVSAVADNLVNPKASPSNSTLIIERENATAGPTPSSIPSESLGSDSGSNM